MFPGFRRGEIESLSNEEREFWFRHAERIKALDHLNLLHLMTAKGSEKGWYTMNDQLKKKVYLPHELEVQKQDEEEQMEEEQAQNWASFKAMFGGGKIK